MLRIALIGCGKIADQHVQAIRRVPGSEVVAVCDQERLMAQQLAERFKIAACFADVGEMLRDVAPDVVHITTPPQSHHVLALQCLEAGSHVYLEKPFTVTAPEAQSLVDAARRTGRHITAGHNYQFSFEMLRMRELRASGFLGGNPVHIESYWSYDLGDTSYVGPLLGNANHWVRRLPGGLLQNIISHGIARLAEFLDDDVPVVLSSAHQSEQLRQLGGKEVLDELRVMMRDGKGTTASFCFSTQIKPGLNQLRIHGPSNSITVDFSSGSVVRHLGRSYKSYLTYLLPSWLSGWQQIANSWRNAVEIVRWRLYQDAGLKELVQRFHVGIVAGGPPPIPYREILLTARLMDQIFDGIRVGAEPAVVERPRVAGQELA